MDASLGFAGPQTCAQLKFHLLRNAERIINLDPETADGVSELGMPEEELYASQVACLLVNLSRLCPAQRVRAV
jgi:hypothetical protein